MGHAGGGVGHVGVGVMQGWGGYVGVGWVM